MAMVLEAGAEDAEANGREKGREEEAPDAVLGAPVAPAVAAGGPEWDAVIAKGAGELAGKKGDPEGKCDCIHERHELTEGGRMEEQCRDSHAAFWPGENP